MPISPIAVSAETRAAPVKPGRSLTLNVEKLPDGGGYILCADDGRRSAVLARFVSEEASKTFLDALNLTRAVAHAMGQIGI